MFDFQKFFLSIFFIANIQNESYFSNNILNEIKIKNEFYMIHIEYYFEVFESNEFFI